MNVPDSVQSGSRISVLWLAHCLLAWTIATATAIANVPLGWLATLVLFVSHILLCGLIIGLLLSDSPGPVRHQQSRPLKRFALGLLAVWAPVAFIAGGSRDGLGILVGGLYGALMAVGFLAVVVGITLAAFSLSLTDEPIGGDSLPAPRNRQFSLRQLIGLTTFVAVICALLKLADGATGVIADLAAGFWIFGGIILGIGLVWLVSIAVPLFVVFVTSHPWRNALIAIDTVVIITISIALAVPSSGTDDFTLTLAIVVASHMILVMGSLGVLRSCGLRLTRHRTAYELARGQDR